MFSEHDVAEMRSKWDADRERADWQRELIELRGRFDGFSSTLPELVRSLVREVMAEERKTREGRRTADMRWIVGILVGGLVLVVPFESLIITRLTTGVW